MHGNSINLCTYDGFLNYLFLPSHLATLENIIMLKKNDGKQMKREVAAKRVRGKEYEEVNQIKGLKFNSAYNMYCECIPIFENVVVFPK